MNVFSRLHNIFDAGKKNIYLVSCLCWFNKHFPIFWYNSLNPKYGKNYAESKEIYEFPSFQFDLFRYAIDVPKGYGVSFMKYMKEMENSRVI